jgi:hypothetical protein
VGNHRAQPFFAPDDGFIIRFEVAERQVSALVGIAGIKSTGNRGISDCLLTWPGHGNYYNENGFFIATKTDETTDYRRNVR